MNYAKFNLIVKPYKKQNGSEKRRIRVKYDFDRVVDRVHTNDMKWHSKAVSAYLGREIPEDMVPMWLADTEFACAPVIVEAVKRRADKEIYGYCAPMPDFYKAVCWWQKKRFDWTVDPSWVTPIPTVVAGINAAVRAFSREGDGVILQQPVYDPFAEIIQRTGRTLVNNALVERDGRFEMDLEGLEALAADPKNKVMVLCSPHNPVGRVWTEGELRAVAEICLKHGVLLVSDEIHGDIVYRGHAHHPVLSLDERYAAHTIHLTAPGKTFNVAGLKMSMAIIPDSGLRRKFYDMVLAMSLDVRNTFGLECVSAAYTPEGEEWLKEELAYLEGNVEFAMDYVKQHLPGARLARPEGTFLCWLDLSALGYSDEALFERILLRAAVICVPGPWFGPGGEGHMRLNIGCPRALLETALRRIAKALE